MFTRMIIFALLGTVAASTDCTAIAEYVPDISAYNGIQYYMNNDFQYRVSNYASSYSSQYGAPCADFWASKVLPNAPGQLELRVGTPRGAPIVKVYLNDVLMASTDQVADTVTLDYSGGEVLKWQAGEIKQYYIFYYLKLWPVGGCDDEAVSAGDPHIERFDGTAFDIDTTGTYSLFNVAGGAQFSVKSTVAPQNRVGVGKYNMGCEFGGSWLGGHNVTAVAGGGESGSEAGIYFDGNFVSIPNLLQNTSQYTREFTGHSKMILEICQVANDMSDYCISTVHLRRQSHGGHAHMTMVTDLANVTLRFSATHSGHLDIYTALAKDVDSTQIGGLLAGAKKRQIRHGDSPLLASSVGAVHE